MEVVVRFLESTIPLKLSPDSSVATLKSYLETLTGLPAPLQHLYTEKRDLLDTDRIRQCPGSVLLRLDGSSALPLRFVVHPPSEDAFPLLLKMRDTAQSIKAELKREAGIDASGQVLVLGQRLLQESQTVAEVLAPGTFDLFIGENSIPHTEVAARHITIKTYPSDFAIADISSSETVSAFLRRWGRPGTWLVYRDRALESSARLSAVSESVVWGNLLLHIRTGGIASFDFAVTSNLTVNALKRAIARRLEAADISLVYRGLLLEDGRSLKDCGCEQEETIEAVLHRYFWVESDTERVSIRDSEREVEAAAILQKYRAQTADHRDFQWMLLDGKLLQPAHRYSVRSGAVVQLIKGGYLLPVATATETYHAAVSDIYTVQLLQQELSRRYGLGQLFARNSALPPDLHLHEASHLPLSFARQNEQIFAFRFSNGCELFLPFHRNTPTASVVSRLQSALSTTDSLQLMGGEKSIIASLSDAAKYEFIYVCRNTEVTFVGQGSALFRYVTLPTFNMKVADLKVYCGKGVVPLFFTSRFLSYDEYLCDCNIKVGSLIEVLDSSVFMSDLTISPHKKANKYIILKQLDSTQHLVRLHEDDTWDSFTACIQGLFGEAFILLCKQFLFTANRFPSVSSGKVLQAFKSSDEVVVILSSFGSVEWVPAPRTFTIQQVKEAARVQSDRSLVFRDIVLDDKKTLESLELTATDVLMPAHSTERIVKIRRPDAETLFLVIKEKSPYVSELLQLAHYCIGPSHSRLYVNGNKLLEKERVMLYSELWLADKTHICVSGELSNGISTYVFVRRSGTVGDLRVQFAERLLVHRSSLRLLFSYCALDNDHSTLEQIGINEGRIVTILKPQDLLVTVADDRVRLQLSKSHNCSIIEVKEATAKALKTVVKNVHLINRNQLLSNSSTLEPLAVTNELTVRLLLLETGALLAFYSLQGQHSFTVLPADQVTFSSVLSAAGQVASSPQLYWVGELSNERTIGEYCLQMDSEVCLLPHAVSTEDNVVTTIHTVHGVSHMKTNRHSSVKQFLSCFSRNRKRLGWQVVINGEFADTSKSLSDCGFDERCEATLITRDEAEVKVTLPSGRVVVMVTQCAAPAEEIKDKLFAVTGIPTEMQILSSCGLQSGHLASRLVKVALEVKHGFQLLESTSGYVVVPCGSVGAAKSALSETGARMMCDDRDLRDDEVLPVNAFLLRAEEKRIYVKSPLSPPLPVYMKDSGTIKEVKERLQTLSNLPHPLMRLIATVPVRGDKELAAIRSSSRTLRFSIDQTKPDRGNTRKEVSAVQ